MKLVGRFEFFGQHLALRGPKPAHHARPFLRPGGAGGKFWIGVKVVLDTVAEKNLVPKHILRAVKNGLAGNEALSRQRKRCGHSLFGRNRFHTSYIGVAVAELQAELRVCHLRENRDTAKNWCPTRFGAAPRGCGRPWPTLVMSKCGKLRAFPPCAVGHFMSNIKML